MQQFNTSTLKKAVSLVVSKTDVDLDSVSVKNATYHGDTYPEGIIPLNTGRDHAVDLNTIRKIRNMMDLVFNGSPLVQIGTRNRKAVLFVYLN